jgi:TolA-binding protein
MRFHLLGLVLLAGAAMPAAAQQADRIDRRVERLEQELRAVQRKVFPAGNVEPEISSAQPQSAQPGLPATSPVADLTARVDALERQLATLTGQAEAGENRLRQVEQSLAGLRETIDARLDVLERAAAPEPAAQPASTGTPRLQTNLPTEARTTSPAVTAPPRTSAPAVSASTISRSGVDQAEEAYNAGFHLWEQKRYGEAEQALEAMARKYPQHRLASWARNLAGRAYLDEGKPATAARALLANYTENPRGERAADSLFFLGQALFKLNKPADACKAYDELQDVYGQTMRDYIKQNLPRVRTEARCR